MGECAIERTRSLKKFAVVVGSGLPRSEQGAEEHSQAESSQQHAEHAFAAGSIKGESAGDRANHAG